MNILIRGLNLAHDYFWSTLCNLCNADGATGMLAEELRCLCRVVRGQQAVPVGATFANSIQVQIRG